MADWEGLTDEEKRIAQAVYNKITDSNNAVDFDEEVTASEGMTLLSVDRRNGILTAGYVGVATSEDVEQAVEEAWR